MEFTQQSVAPEVLQAQQMYKASKEAFKAAILTLSTQQSNLKVQRKTVNFPSSAVRELDASLATSTHAVNRYDLKHHYIAYHQFRRANSSYCKSIPECTFDQKLVDKIIAKYASKTVHLNQN